MLPHRALALLIVPCALACAGCSPTLTTKLDANANATAHADLKGDMTARVELAGPIQINMQGPVVTYKGTYVSEGLFGRILVGNTKPDWILAVIGEPDIRAPLDDGTEIWRWAYRPVQQQGSLLSVFGSNKDEPKLQTVTCYVRLDKGVVIEKWRD